MNEGPLPWPTSPGIAQSHERGPACSPPPPPLRSSQTGQAYKPHPAAGERRTSAHCTEATQAKGSTRTKDNPATPPGTTESHPRETKGRPRAPSPSPPTPPRPPRENPFPCAPAPRSLRTHRSLRSGRDRRGADRPGLPRVLCAQGSCFKIRLINMAAFQEWVFLPSQSESGRQMGKKLTAF